MFFLTNTVVDELGGAGIGQGLQQEDTHFIPDGNRQGLCHRASSCPQQFEPHIQDRSFQCFIWVQQGRAQVLQQGHWWTEMRDRWVTSTLSEREVKFHKEEKNRNTYRQSKGGKEKKNRWIEEVKQSLKDRWWESIRRKKAQTDCESQKKRWDDRKMGLKASSVTWRKIIA